MEDIRLRYNNIMIEINARHEAIFSILDDKTSTGYAVTDIEFIALQYRKILELIMMASLVANADKFEQISKKIMKMHSLSEIEKFVKRKNVDFFPIPLKRIKYNNKIVLARADYGEENMNYEALRKAWAICSSILHAKNPFDENINHDKKEKEIASFHNKTVGLLQEHLVRLSNKECLHVIMKSKETDKPLVKYYKCFTNDHTDN